MVSLKLIIVKGPREGETLKYSSGSLINVGRVVKGNTIAIKDNGISSKHLCLQFDNELSKWTVCDLDSSNGTILNGRILNPHVPSVLEDDDCIKIGELTSIVVKMEAESTIQPRRNTRRQGKSKAEARPAAVVVENVKTELGLGFDGDLDKNEVKKPVTKRNLRRTSKKGVDPRSESESTSSSRILRSSRKEEVSFVPSLTQIPESLNLDAGQITDLPVPIQPRRTRGRKMAADQLSLDPDSDKQKPTEIDIVAPVSRRTRGRRKGLGETPLEDSQTSGFEENLINRTKESSPVEKAKEGGSDKFLDLEKMTLGDFFDYLELQLPKEIYDKSDKIIADLEAKARKCHEFRLQRHENLKGKGKLV